MNVEVVTTWTPRPAHDKWRDDYLALLDLQRRTCERFGHRHTVMTDVAMPAQFNAVRCYLPASLMRAMIGGVMQRLEMPIDSHLLFVDADCLVARSLDAAFEDGDEPWDMKLTRREHDSAPVNNGAMYVHRNGVRNVLPFFCKALARCGDHWGADQEAISYAAAPVPANGDEVEREGARILFVSMRKHAAVPKIAGKRHDVDPYVVHFKGDEPKAWAQLYADSFIFPEAVHG